MDVRHHMIRDAGMVAATCVVMAGGASAAAAKTAPNPHNFVPPKTHVLHMHADPHNFAKPQQL